MGAIPEQEEIAEWTSDKLFDYAVDSWLWGERCSIANTLNQYYFECAIKKDKEACDRHTRLLAEIRSRKAPE